MKNVGRLSIYLRYMPLLQISHVKSPYRPRAPLYPWALRIHPETILLSILLGRDFYIFLVFGIL